MEKQERLTHPSSSEEKVMSEVEPTFERLTKREYLATLAKWDAPKPFVLVNPPQAIVN